MIGRQTKVVLLFYVVALPALLFGPLRAAAQQVPGERNDLRVTAVDTTDFPTVAVRVLTTAAGGAPITDLSRLILREDGVPVTDTTTAQKPVGMDLVMVLDANTDFLQFDDSSSLSRRDKTAAGVARYAGQFMNPAGLDRVSVVAPDETGEGATFLAQDAARPSDLADAVNAYNPTPPRVTPLQDMLTTAVAHLVAGEDGRFKAILLYTDGARLNDQLDYQPLVEAAQAAGVPIYVAILGAEAADEEIANVTGLYSPTNGLYLHMPEPEAADPIYDIFRAQGQQTEITYNSDARRDGPHEVSVSLGNVRDTAEYDLSLAAPEIVIESPRATVRRAGSAIDTPLPLLQPAVLPLTARIIWPDGRPRRLTEINFQVDGVAQPVAADFAPDGSGQLPLAWDISERDAGTYRLDVEVADELGFRASAAPVEITIEVTRPSPPTPTVAPTRAPVTIPGLDTEFSWLLLLPAALIVGGVGAAVGLWRRARRQAADTPAAPPPRIIPASGPADDRHVAVLEWSAGDGGSTTGDEGSEQIELTAADVTLGSEPDAVDIVLDDPGVSRLHARIRRAANGEYWLYDEGSILGTFLNYQRLGLAPRQLQHGDVVQLGRVVLRFRLELPRGD